ncbi:MAG: YdbH domain-containing protein [Desulfobacterium sp.]
MNFKSIFKICLISGAGIVLLGLVFMPHLAQWGINAALSSQPGLDSLKVMVRHIGTHGATMGPIRMGNHMVADGVTVNYSLSSLIQQRPNQINISGMDIRTSLTEDGIAFTDFPFLFSSNDAPPPSSPLPHAARPMEGLLRHLPSRVNITHSRLGISLNGREISIPFDLSALIPWDKQELSLGFHVFPLGQPVHGAVLMNRSGGIKHFELAARGIEYGRFNDLLHPWFPGVSLQGRGDLILTGEGDGSVSLRLSRLSLAGPHPVTMRNLVITLVPGDSPAVPGLPFIFPLHALLNFEWDRGAMPALFMSGRFDLTREGAWQLTLMDQHKKTTEYFFKVGDTELSLGRGSRFQLDASGEGAKGEIRVHMVANDLMIQNIPLPVKVSHVAVNGSGTFDLSPLGHGLAMDLTTTLGRVEGENNRFQIHFPGGTLPLGIRVDLRGQPVVSGAIKVKNGRLSHLGRDSLVISGVNMNIPFSWPLGIPGRRGTFSGESLSFNGHPICSLGGEVVHTKQGMNFSGTVHFPFWVPVPTVVKNAGPSKTTVPHINFDMKASFLPPLSSAMELTWDMPPFFLTRPMVLKSGLLSPDVELPQFKTTLAAQGHMILGKGAPQNHLQLNLTQGELDLVDKELEIKGINATLVFDELPRIRSAPGMVLTMDSLRLNKVVVTDAQFQYTMESMTSFLLEKASFKWCNGTVTTGATRFSSGIDAYHISLFCDRLRFADVLQQVGSFKAEGEGSLNGRIPISWVKGELSFDNGFLYSTPGLGGTIQVSNTEVLTAGIPVNTAQFGQMDLAREALKNYTYKWARVGFNSQGEDLMVKLEFDGSPETNLPFEYQKKLGTFVRVDATSPGSHFQGIKLDVNLTLPFNRVMKLGNRLNQLF